VILPPRLYPFLSVYSRVIVYRPETKPLQIVAILHDSRDLAAVLPTSLNNRQPAARSQ